MNSEDKASAKMSELDLITFVGISKSWHAFDESRFNISFSISVFEILLSLKYIFVLLLFITTYSYDFYCSIDFAIGSSIWSMIFTDLSWYFGIFRFEITSIKKILRTSTTLSFLSKIKSCSTNIILLWVETFSEREA